MRSRTPFVQVLPKALVFAVVGCCLSLTGCPQVKPTINGTVKYKNEDVNAVQIKFKYPDGTEVRSQVQKGKFTMPDARPGPVDIAFEKLPIPTNTNPGDNNQIPEDMKKKMKENMKGKSDVVIDIGKVTKLDPKYYEYKTANIKKDIPAQSQVPLEFILE